MRARRPPAARRDVGDPVHRWPDPKGTAAPGDEGSGARPFAVSDLVPERPAARERGRHLHDRPERGNRRRRRADPRARAVGAPVPDRLRHRLDPARQRGARGSATGAPRRCGGWCPGETERCGCLARGPATAAAKIAWAPLMRVWIDMTASAHPLVFRPLVALLEARGDEVEITARDYAQTLQLIEQHGMTATPIGHHGGRSRLGKARQLSSRLGALRTLRARARLRHRARPRLARADDHGAPARDPERDDVRLRVGVAAAPARLPRRDEGRRARLDPGRAARPLRRGAAEAAPATRG